MKPEPAPRTGPDTPRPGEAVEVAPGILWLRFPLPFALDHVNLFALQDGDGWTLVDTGFGDETSKGVWLELLDGPLRARPIRRLVVTHFHPDHVGLAGWLAARTGAELLMVETEWLVARYLCAEEPGAALATALAFYRAAGVDAARLQALEADGHVYPRRITPPPATFTPLVPGAALAIGGRRFEVRIGEGHSPAQAVLWCAEERLLLAADQILPRISPNVPVWPQAPTADPLARFTASLTRLRELPAATRVLPAHDWPFENLHGRIDTLLAFHDARLEATLAAVGRGATAFEVMGALFPRVDDVHQLRFALGETLAHLNRLVADGGLVRATEDGRWRFVPAR
ncbi:MAG: MBL fold metallo-hydrolase [Deinococcus-Thermus bacterium]|jgi:glyoxylase-like metal-dependent hydrolase (beta-lactamase superfamily II)|nr:MBL fold metallo-hydrolase [Deinococcota bacterium]